MSFQVQISLTSGFIKHTMMKSAESSREAATQKMILLQILRIVPLTAMEPSKRYKIVLSDGLRYCSCVVAPRLNERILAMRRFSIIKLIEFEIFNVEKHKLFVVSDLQEVVRASTLLGNPISVHSNGSSPSGGRPLSNPTGHNNNNAPTIIVPKKKTGNLQADLAEMFFDSKDLFSDVQFSLKNDTTCKAHKIILASRSMYFQALFTTEMKEKSDNTFAIDQWEPEIFQAVIQYLYTDNVALSLMMPEVPRTKALENLISLALAGRFFLLPQLVSIVERILISEYLDVGDICNMAEIAEKQNFPNLARACKLAFFANFEAISPAQLFQDAELVQSYLNDTYLERVPSGPQIKQLLEDQLCRLTGSGLRRSESNSNFRHLEEADEVNSPKIVDESNELDEDPLLSADHVSNTKNFMDSQSVCRSPVQLPPQDDLPLPLPPSSRFGIRSPDDKTNRYPSPYQVSRRGNGAYAFRVNLTDPRQGQQRQGWYKPPSTHRHISPRSQRFEGQTPSNVQTAQGQSNPTQSHGKAKIARPNPATSEKLQNRNECDTTRKFFPISQEKREFPFAPLHSTDLKKIHSE